jgi:hypothetical protein
MAKSIGAAVREVCLSFPGVEEILSHGSPNFRVSQGKNKGKVFAAYAVNHHGDGRVALWLNSPPGAQEIHVKGEPKYFFVPPYVGPSGWLGVNLDKGLSWKRIAMLVREAYEKVAPRKLAEQIGETIVIEPPTAKLSPVEMDPMQGKRPQMVLNRLRKIGASWPEVTDGEQFGAPTLKAGQKTFALAYYNEKRLKLGFWVGVERQTLLTADKRFSIPKYTGHNGWIELDVAHESYRHFANRRMLAALDAPARKSKRKS